MIKTMGISPTLGFDTTTTPNEVSDADFSAKVYNWSPLFLVPINRLVFSGFLQQKLSSKDIDDNVVHFITLDISWSR